NSFGDSDTTMFHVAVIASERPIAITAKFADIPNSVECNPSNPIDPTRLIKLPMMIGFLFPILLIINGAILAIIRNIIMKGSWTFGASIAFPPNPSGTGLLTSCTIDGYAMNMVIPIATRIRYDGRRVLSLSSLKSSSGELVLLSIITNIDNEIIDATNAAAIPRMFPAISPVCTSVSAIMNAAVAAERATAPLISMRDADDDASSLL